VLSKLKFNGGAGTQTYLSFHASKHQSETSRDDGNIAYELLQQTSLANHFTLVEEWANRKALEAHIMAAHTRLFSRTTIAD
jgi:quinol monooxygenase YgiN